MSQSTSIDIARDRQGRVWVKDFPQYVRLPSTTGASPSAVLDWSMIGEGVTEIRLLFRFANGKAEYVVDAVDNSEPVGRLIHGVMDRERPDLDDDGYVVTREDISNQLQADKAAAAAAAAAASVNVSAPDDIDVEAVPDARDS